MELVLSIITALVVFVSSMWWIYRKNKGCLCYLDNNEKRWLLIGLQLHTIIVPFLRTYVKKRLDELWDDLKTKHNIDIQQHPNQLPSYQSTYLNYEAINNNNKIRGCNRQKQFDYNVKNSVDLSKLFIHETNMIKHAGFDDSCDASALLKIISGICPRAKASSDRIKSEVRNSWAHCDFRQWTETKYQESLDLMKQFIKDLGVLTKEETEVFTRINIENENGRKFIEGTSPEDVSIADLQTQVQVLMKHVDVIADLPKDIQNLKRKLTEVNTNLRERIQDVEQNVQKIEGSVGNLEKKIDECRESVPSHIKDQHKIHLEEWLKEEGTFTVTRASRYVTKLIGENNVVVVTGSSGSGKSSIIHHVALELQSKEKYDIISFVISPDDILQYRDLQKNQVFVIDDICGKNFLNEQDLQTWKENADKIEKCLLPENKNYAIKKKVDKKGNFGLCKILVSCRLHIFKDKKFKSIEIFNKQSVDLQSKDYCLLPKERHIMISKYTTLSDYNLQKLDKVMDKCSFFPLLCKMSKGKKVKQLTELFTSPVNSIKNDIKDMIEYKHFEFCALVLCVLFPNELDETYINHRKTPQDVKVKVTEIVANFKIDLKIELERKRLVDTFNRLDGTYIKKTGSVYSIAHDKLYDMVAVTCGQKLVELFIEYSPSSFIAERFRLLSGQNLEQDDSFLYLSDDIENVYFDRIFRDLKEQDGTSFFHNQQLKEKRYKDKVMGYIKEHTDSCKQVFLELDDKGLIDENRPIRGHYNTSTPMIEASGIGFYELVKYLISIKCNVNKTDSFEFSPLWYCMNGPVNVVELLITNGVNIQDALCDACLWGNINIVRMCLERNVDVSQSGGELGMTPLFTACVKGHTDIVRLLLQSNADPRQSPWGLGGLTPLHVVENETIKNLLKSYIKD